MKIVDKLRESIEVVLHKTKDYGDNVIHSMAEALFVISREGTIQSVNQAACTLLAYQEHELVGVPVAKIFEEEDFPFRGTGLHDLIEKGAIRGIEKTCLAKDGTRIPVLLSGAVMRDETGNTQGVVCVAMDITKRKRAEDDLWNSEKKFREFFENAPEYCYVISPDGVILDLNRTALEVLGYKKEEIVGKLLGTIYAPECLPRAKELFAKWKKTGHLEDEELVIVTKKETSV